MWVSPQGLGGHVRRPLRPFRRRQVQANGVQRRAERRAVLVGAEALVPASENCFSPKKAPLVEANGLLGRPQARFSLSLTRGVLEEVAGFTCHAQYTLAKTWGGGGETQCDPYFSPARLRLSAAPRAARSPCRNRYMAGRGPL